MTRYPVISRETDVERGMIFASKTMSKSGRHEKHKKSKHLLLLRDLPLVTELASV